MDIELDSSEIIEQKRYAFLSKEEITENVLAFIRKQIRWKETNGVIVQATKDDYVDDYDLDGLKDVVQGINLH